MGNKNSPRAIPNHIKLSALPLLFSKYLDTAVEAVWAIKPCPDNLKKNNPKNKKIIPSTKEKNNADKNKKKVTIIE